MKLYILRHAQSVANEEGIADSILDTELSGKGKKDAQELTSPLAQNSYDIFIVSPLKRTIETVQPFLDTLKNPVVTVEPFTIERDIGEFAGTQIGTFTQYCKDNGMDKVSCKSKEGESIIDVYKRAEKFFDLLVSKYNNKSILVTGHKIFLHSLELAISNKPAETYYLEKGMSNGEIRELKV